SERFLNNDLNNDRASFNINFSVPKSTSPSIIKGANSYFHFDGFGYDQSRDDYLIVVLSHDPTIVSLYLEFFSFRDNTWKAIEGTRFPYTVNYSKGMLYNEAIHWLSFRHDLQKNVIVVFDLMERKLLFINLPDDFNLEYQSRGLWVFGEHLSFWAMDYNNGRFEIWVMKEYKVHSSWTIIGLPLHPITNRYLCPMYCTKNGDIIGISGISSLVKYNDKGQLLRHRSFSNNPPEEVIMYTESLLSLPGDNEQV
ncbi:F-box protein, partial [Trifolium medium]|nr:F-box protein [Trifolium medium]